MKGHRTTRSFIIGAVAFAAVVFLSSQVQASLKSEIQHGEITHLNIIDGTTSDIIEAEFAFQMIGASWQSDDAVNISLRYSNEDGWSDWYPIDETVENKGWQYAREPIISNNATKFQYSVSSGNIDNLKVIYLGESKKLIFNKWNPARYLKKFLHKVI